MKTNWYAFGKLFSINWSETCQFVSMIVHMERFFKKEMILGCDKTADKECRNIDERKYI